MMLKRKREEEGREGKGRKMAVEFDFPSPSYYL